MKGTEENRHWSRLFVCLWEPPTRNTMLGLVDVLPALPSVEKYTFRHLLDVSPESHSRKTQPKDIIVKSVRSIRGPLIRNQLQFGDTMEATKHQRGSVSCSH